MENHLNRYRLNSIIGAGLIGLGILFLLGEITDIHLINYLWPFFIILPGLAFFYFMVQGGKNAAPLAIPGSIITMTGLLLFYQSITNHWESWAYAWALVVPTSLGIGLYITGMRTENESLRHIGQGFIKVGLTILLVLGLFFELIVRLGPDRHNRLIWPILLIVAGIYMVLERFGLLPSRKTADSSNTIEIEKEE